MRRWTGAGMLVAADAMASPTTAIDGEREDQAWHRAALQERYSELYPTLRVLHHAISDAQPD